MKTHEIHNVAELIDALRTDIREVEDDSVETLRLMWRAADALEAAEKRIAELERILKAVQENSGINFRMWQEAEAQLPTEGEWIEQDDGDSIFFKCSVCGKIQYNVLLEMMQGEYHYCPNCGAKMKTVTDCHTFEGANNEQ